MQVVIHAGAHVTDEDRLLNCLLRNRDLLSDVGTDVPQPSVYRKLLRDILTEATRNGVSDETRDIVLAAIARDETADRLVLSNENFFGTPKMAVGPGMFYPAAPPRLEGFHEIFSGDRIELFLALRNPATYLPALLNRSPEASMATFLSGHDPAAFRWSDLIARIRAALPDLPITVWCNEDTPLIWAEVVREMAGLEPAAGFDGEFELLAEIMTPGGMTRFESYLESHPGMTEIQKRRVISAFLDKFVNEDAIEEELDIPGWSEDLIDRLSTLYDEDLYEVQRIPGVTMITP